MLTPKIIDTVGSSTAIGGIAHGILRIGDGFADGDVFDPGQTDDVAGRRLLDVDASQPLEREQLGHLGRLHLAVELADRDLIADPHPAVEDPADGDPSEIVAGVEVGDQHLEGGLRDCHAAAGT